LKTVSEDAGVGLMCCGKYASSGRR